MTTMNNEDPADPSVQSDEDTYDIERTVVGSVVAGVTADRCGQCGACDRSMVPLELGNREASDMEMTERNKDAPTQTVGGPFAWLMQSTTERNPPHGWAVYMFNGQGANDAVPVYLQSEVDRLRAEAIAAERERDYLLWRIREIIPLFEEARDALCAISLVAATAYRVDLSLGSRMDAAGTRTREEFDAMLTAAEKEQPK